MKLLLIRNDNIGDLVCTTPLIQLLRETYPEATIDLLGNSYNVEILKYDPRLSHLWSYRKAKHLHGFLPKITAWIEKIVLLLRLRLQQYDVIIIAVPVFNERTTSLALFIHPKHAIYGAMPDRPLRSRLPKSYHPVTIDHNKSHVLQVLTYGQALGINSPTPEAISLTLSPEEKKAALAERSHIPGGQEKPVLGIQLSARRPNQQWSLTAWKEFISMMLPHTRIRLLWSPGKASSPQHPGDDDLAVALSAAFPDVLLAQPTTDLRQLMVALSGCDFIVGPDGGAMHVAAGLDIPTLTLFGDVDPHIWAPYSKKAHFLKSPSDSLADLAPREVAEKIRRL
ncbi:MAG: glycosyltransferase family 9 protein [Chthoniobacterales bacterium]